MNFAQSSFTPRLGGKSSHNNYYISGMEMSQEIGHATAVANKNTRMERAHGTELFKQAAAAANPNSVERVLHEKKEELTHDNKNGVSKIIDESANRMGVDIKV